MNDTDPLKHTLVAFAGHDLLHPVDEDRLDALLSRLALDHGARVVELGAAKGELLIRLAESYGIRGTGIDERAELVELARGEAESRTESSELEFVDGQPLAFEIDEDEEPFDLAIAVETELGPLGGVLERLSELVRPGGEILLGVRYLRREPGEDLLAESPPGSLRLPSLADAERLGTRFGLRLIEAVRTSRGSLDDWEKRQRKNIERYTVERADDPEADGLLAWATRERHLHRDLDRRDVVGFAILRFQLIDAPTLSGPRVVLRPAIPEDALDLSAIRSNPSVARWWGEATPHDIRADLIERDEVIALTITVEGRIAGMIQFAEEEDPDYRHASLDIFIGDEFRGEGIGGEAITLVVAHLIRDLGHHRLTIDPAAANEGAIRAYARCGFRTVGVMRGYERAADGTWRDGVMMEYVVGVDDVVPAALRPPAA